ncbi:phospholipase D-like domain-containing protein [Pseudoxanthomonas kalamensis]|uniref:phospholipase D-like domain-containing protein n=1 Tax=Pseudoxanthomonas kalamensis TaxID=289483 RepID=UPI0013910F8E|nr:phospholipase D family protein [Pseudoxanthomonas kalamensis]
MRAVRGLWVLVVLALAACAQLPPRAELPDEFASPPATSGALAELLDPLQSAHPDQSGFRLVSSGAEAYALRAYSARVAEQNLDIQTYIWHDDLTGRLLARRALDAADRGVRVRILVDDLDARAKNRGFAALDAHPRIEVRLYNPMASRSGALSQAGEFATGFKRLNHRMHNKSWIVDNRIALAGGRNLGDEYFGASEETNFVDLDMLMVGPAATAVQVNFDHFWNAPSNYPIAQLSPQAASESALQALREALDGLDEELRASPYAQVLREDPEVEALLRGEGRLQWSSDWRFVSDDPMKASLPKEERSAVLQTLLPAMAAAQQQLRLISPYFVPGEAGAEQLVRGAQRGLEIRILTNSLVATDVAAVHGGYARYRRDLLEGGVQLWELKPNGQGGRQSLRGSSGSSLHTKAMVMDDDEVFVGSYNLDPRSTSLNCEQGVLVRHPALAEQLAAIFQRQLRPRNAWQVQLRDGRLVWSDGEREWEHEPEAGATQRFLAWLMKLMPVESQL